MTKKRNHREVVKQIDVIENTWKSPEHCPAGIVEVWEDLAEESRNLRLEEDLQFGLTDAEKTDLYNIAQDVWKEGETEFEMLCAAQKIYKDIDWTEEAIEYFKYQLGYLSNLG